MKKLTKIMTMIMLFGLLFTVVPTVPTEAASDDFTVNVKLMNKLGLSSTFYFTPKGESVLKENKNVVLTKDKKYTVQQTLGLFTIKDGSKVIASALAKVTIEPKVYSKANHVILANTESKTVSYPHIGTIVFRASGLKIQAVNSLYFEDYLKGVVPAEMSASWGSPTSKGMEALKAQAIAARSYVFSKMNQTSLEIDDTTTYQVYSGFIWDKLSPSYNANYQYSNQAVDETKGQILTYQKTATTKGFVTAYFSSSNGGQTELPEQYWTGKLPYLTESKEDAFDKTSVTWKLNWMKQQLPATVDLAKPAGWWTTASEANLASAVDLKSRTAFESYKNYVLKELKKKDPAIDSIKIASIDNIQTKNYSNTGKVAETKIDLSYYVKNTNGKFDMVPGAASQTLSGATRYDTAVEIAKEYVGTGKANTLVIGRGDVPADALAGTVLAHKHKAPILMVKQNSIPASVQSFMEEQTNKGATVYLLGGKVAISAEVEEEIQSKGFNTIRISGKDRTGTSLAIAKEVGSFSKVIFATGDDNSSDALSASSYAASKQIPIIIQKGQKTAAQTKTFLAENGTSSAILIGGTAVISETVENELGLAGLNTKRISGTTRVDTSIAINKELPLTGANIVIGNGYQFIDALAGSVLAAKTGSPILMVHPEVKNLPVDFFEALATKHQAYFLGGSLVITDDLKTGINKFIAGALKENKSTIEFKGSTGSTMTTFRTTVGGTNLMSTDFDILNQSDRFVMDGAGFGHGIGMSQYGALYRAKAGHSAKEILDFYFQGAAIQQTTSFIN
ncbi:SpoIID/LytB domain-containing protein [Planococcus sp. YIM B11945]|uniref:SpoIID/LytB domain-containing protein n=1 Tax=Planococcus sp. YIM B11945 TaxID=3435410 RepID=UPI003D7DB3DF